MGKSHPQRNWVKSQLAKARLGNKRVKARAKLRLVFMVSLCFRGKAKYRRNIKKSIEVTHKKNAKPEGFKKWLGYVDNFILSFYGNNPTHNSVCAHSADAY